jgi:hypothetical protein
MESCSVCACDENEIPSIWRPNHETMDIPNAQSYGWISSYPPNSTLESLEGLSQYTRNGKPSQITESGKNEHMYTLLVFVYIISSN